MIKVVNEVDQVKVFDKIKEHDPGFDQEGETGQIYKDNVYYFKVAKNVEEEKEFDVDNILSYLVMSPRYLYCINIDTYEWVFEPVNV